MTKKQVLVSAWFQILSVLVDSAAQDATKELQNHCFKASQQAQSPSYHNSYNTSDSRIFIIPVG